MRNLATPINLSTSEIQGLLWLMPKGLQTIVAAGYCHPETFATFWNERRWTATIGDSLISTCAEETALSADRLSARAQR
jgi:hypothetical protein